MTDTNITINLGKHYKILELEARSNNITIEEQVKQAIDSYATAIYDDADSMKYLLQQDEK